MSKVVITREIANSIIKYLKSAKKPTANNFTRTSFLGDTSFDDAIIALKDKGFTEDEIIKTIFDAAQSCGIEEGLKYSRKEINAVLNKIVAVTEGQLIEEN